MPRADDFYASPVFDKSVRESGHCVASEALQPIAISTTVRVRNGTTSTNERPLSPQPRNAGGLYMVEARDLNEAIQIASRNSAR